MEINRLILQTGQLSDLKTFYEKVLCIPIIKEDHESFALAIGITILEFHKSESATKPFYHFAINIPSNKIEEAARWMNGKAVLLFMEDYNSHIADFKNWHAQSIYFFDPAGNIVELIARYDLNDVTDEPFSPSQMRSISEMGFVFPEKTFDEAVEKLMKTYDLDYFSKQPPMPQFRAIGDDNGLFIVVPEGRSWYPTKNMRAGIYPFTMVFNNKHSDCTYSV